MKTRSKLTNAIPIALIVLFIIPAMNGPARSQPITQGVITPALGSTMTFDVTLSGRGASFPAPLIFNWASTYHSQNPNVALNYQSVGSGAGQRAFMNKTDDFDATDAPLQPIQRPLTPNVLHIPETIGSVVLAYNIPNSPTGLNLTGSIIAQIYMGQILNWNDPAIQNINPHFTLPSQPITTVHRSDSSGTTFVFTSFLSLDSPSWASTIGKGTTVVWPGSPTGSPPPIAVTGNGNAGVATVIASTQFALGYVELNYALQNNFKFAQVQNPVGNYILPSLTTTRYAVENSTTILPAGNADWSGVSMLNRPGSLTYPIASFSYFIVYKELNVLPRMNLNETFQANALINFLYWAVNAGQQQASALSYVPLPTFVRTLNNASIASITFTTPAKNSRTISLSESATGGWNGSSIGPTITIYSGDTVTLVLSSTDSLNHQWFIDFNNNQILDANELPTASAVFNSPTPTTQLPIVPAIGINVPSAGNWIYRDANNPANQGTIQVLGQQIAAPFLVPSALSSTFAAKLDSSKVTTIGSLIINMRTTTVSGNITTVAVDATSGAITYNKAVLVSGLLRQSGGLNGVQIQFVFNAAVAPYDLGTVTQLQLVAGTATLTHFLTRELDIGVEGFVSANDISIVFADYGFAIGNPNYNPKADLLATGLIDAIDASIIKNNYGAAVYR